MRYDFETLPDRSRAGSTKWNNMLANDPDVPAGIVPLSTGDMELKNPPELVDGLKEWVERNVLGYTDLTASDRRAIGDWFDRRHGWRIQPEWLVNTDGVVPALYTAVNAFTRPGEGVIYMPPVYRPLYHAVNDTGRLPVAVPLVAAEGGYCMDFAGLEQAAARPDVRLLLLCSPHNPVGRVWTREELARLGDICLKNGVLMVSDEIHMDIVMQGRRHTVLSEVNDRIRDASIICTAPSKTFNIAGLQVANIVIPDAAVRRAFQTEHENGGRFEANQIGLVACRVAYERCEGWLDAFLAHIHANARMVRDFMAAQYPEIRVSDHEGTYFLWLDFRAWNKAEAELKRFMTHAARLFPEWGGGFGEGGEGFARINLACPAWVLRDALERLLKAGRP